MVLILATCVCFGGILFLGAWKQRGSDLDGENAGGVSGYTVSLSSNSLVIAIGSTANGSGSEHARVYKYDGTTWQKKR